MGIVIRQSIKSSIATYIGIVLGAINILYFFPLFLLPTDIGLIETLRGIAMIVLPFAQLGLPTIINRFFPYFNNQDLKHHGFLLFSLLTFFAAYILISTLILVFRNNITEYFFEGSPLLAEYFIYVIPLIFYMALFSIMSAYSASFLRITLPTLLQNVILRILILLDIILYGLELITFSNFIFIFINIYAIPLILIFIYVHLLKQLVFKNFRKVIKDKFKDILSFGIFTIFFNASEIFISKIDIVMLSILLSLSDTGIYAIAYFMGSVIEVPRRSITSLALPILSTAFKDQNLSTVKTMYEKTSINQLFIGFLIFLLIWGNIDYIFQFIPNGEIFLAGKYVVLFIGLSKVIDMLMGCNLEIMAASKYYRFNLVSTGALVILIVVTNLIFIPIYGITGAAFASALAILLFNLINYIFIYIKLQIQPFNKNTFLGIVIAGITYLITLLLPDLEDKYLNILLTSSVIVLIYLPSFYWLNISPEVNKLINNFLKIK